MLASTFSGFVLFAQHGWADSNKAIATLAESIAPPNTPVIAPNLGWLRTWVRMEPLIQEVEGSATDALRQFPDHAWRIMGHSMGGLIWIELLHRHPEWWSRVHSLSLVGSPVGGSHFGRIIDPFSLGVAIAKDLGEDRREMAANVASHIPTLVVAGDVDRGSDGTVTLECTKVPRASFVVLPGIGHAELKDHVQVGEAIRSFWANPQIAPEVADTPTQLLIKRLRQLPGITDAHHRDAKKGELVHILGDGSRVTKYRNVANVLHIFILAESGKCLYGGYVGWIHTDGLQAVLAELERGNVKQISGQETTTIADSGDL